MKWPAHRQRSFGRGLLGIESDEGFRNMVQDVRCQSYLARCASSSSGSQDFGGIATHGDAREKPGRIFCATLIPCSRLAGRVDREKEKTSKQERGRERRERERECPSASRAIWGRREHGMRVAPSSPIPSLLEVHLAHAIALERPTCFCEVRHGRERREGK